MDSKRRVGISVTVLLLGHIATAAVLPGNNQTTDSSLDCTNDFEEQMLCQLELQNCTEYSLTLQSLDGKKNCTLQQCGTGQCCCSFQLILVLGETHTAIIWKDDNIMESKVFGVTENIKPKTPTIKSVTESEGNFEVRWTSNMEGFIKNYMTAEVTYYKKGETEKVSELFKPATVGGENYYAINGQDLEPNSTYVVSVKSYISLSGKFSDSSKEWEFQTGYFPAPSPRYLHLTIIIILSIAAVIFSAAMYASYVKFKRNWWDVVTKTLNPGFLDIYPSKEQVFKPEPPITSTICVEPLIPDDSKLGSKMSLTDISCGSHGPSSGISTGSSDLSYANAEPPETMNEEPLITKAVHDVLSKLLNISPISPVTTNPLTHLTNMQKSDLCSAPYSPCSVQANDTSSGSSVFENKTYSLLIPVSEHQAVTGNLESLEKAEMLCFPDYHPSKSDMDMCPHQQVPACQAPAQQDSGSFLRQPDMPYQSYKADSGTFSYAEDTSLSSISSGTNTSDSCDFPSRAEAEFESSDEVISGKPKLGEEVTMCDENPCYGFVPKGSNSFLAVDDDYQALPSLEKQPDILLVEQGNGEYEKLLCKEELFKKTSESILNQVFPGFLHIVQDGHLQIPFSPLMSVDCSVPIITDDGYQAV